ncbi:Ig-like domain-containing protein [Actinoplanes regularis]|uniref:Ig-like domain-containing protein n=1 Tax=Actinoplanes regularis TaxID=52697 RepID=UPI0024A1F173|nr:Ig-like domain-containing protein [Actinoplanes regularis]GLW29068.1 hypothetical protein Areg01_20080 [Actinoplanes regularis]
MRPTSRNIAVVTAAALGVFVAPTAAIAATATHTTTVTGTFSRVVVDGDLSTPGGEQATGTVTQPIVTIDDTVLPLPVTAAAGLRPDSEVEVTVSAPAGVDTPAEVAAAVDDGKARILDADPVVVAPALPAGKAGAHTLTVLPVYWTAPDSQTPATLRATADKTAAYWTEQTAAGITVPTIDVRNWVQIANPGSCDYSTIFNAARAANGTPAVDSRNHVLVYFPRYSSCGWTGLGSMPGGQIWINGYSYGDAWEHEFGHNLGLGHANALNCTQSTATVTFSTSCTVSAYSDYDVMGYARYGDGYSLNTALSDVLGTLNNPVTASAGSLVKLPAVTSITAARAVKVPLTGSTLYLEYRPATGRDASQPTGWGGLQVRQLLNADNQSRILNMNPSAGDSRALPVGATWAVPDTTLTLTVERIDASGADVRIRELGDITPPTAPVIKAPLSGQRVAGTATVRWTASTDAGSGVASYEILLDGTTVSTVNAPATEANVTFPPVTNGQRTLTVTAIDRAGNRSKPATATVTLARVVNAPTGLKAVGDPDGSLVSWTAPIGAQPTGYDILVDGAAKATVPGTATSWRLANGLADGAHVVGVRARDEIGNVSSTAIVKAVLDTTGPSQPTVSSPRAGAVVTGNKAVVGWVAATDSQSGIAAYVVEVDHVQVARVAGTVRTATVVVPDGDHHIGVIAVNGNGLRSTVADALGTTVKATATAPTAARITSPSSGKLTNAASVFVTWAPAIDGGGLARYEILLDGQPAGTAEATATTATVPLVPGAHTLAIRAVDPTGLVSTSAAVKITADTVAPTIAASTVKLRTGSAAGGVPVTLTASATDAGGVCAITATANGTTIGTAKTAKLIVSAVLPAGASVAVTATDCAGNVSTRTDPVSMTSAAETAGQFSGAWTSLSGADYDGGKAASASTAGAAVSMTFTGSQIAWIGSRSTTSGAATVYLDDKKVATVDTRGTAANRQVLWLGAATPGTHTIKIVVVGTAGRPTILVDSLAALS